jgi:hypothetical protein
VALKGDAEMNDPIVPLTAVNLLSKLTNFEDSYIERKTHSESKDWLRTVVGFANSNPVGYPATLFIGVTDDGTPEKKAGVNLEKLQQSFTHKMKEAYPPIYFTTRILEKDGAQFVAVIVPGSPSRPHFAGQAYVRKGNRTEAASEQRFEELLASRLSKSAEIPKWITKTVTITWMRTEHTHVLGPVVSEASGFVTACNSFYFTYADQIGGTGKSVPLRRVEGSYDNTNSRLKLEIYPA